MFTFLSKMFDVGDLPVLTFSNCILKAGLLSGLLNYNTFLRFFQNWKKQDFTFFELLHTFSRILDVTNWSNHWSLVTEFSEFGVPRQLCTCVCFRYWKRTKMLKKCRRSTQIWKKRFCSAVHYSNFRLISGVIKLVTYGRANRQTVKGIAMQ